MIHWLISATRVLPMAVYKTVFELDYEAYREHYDTVIYDLDNTLLPYDDSTVTDQIYQLFETLSTLDYKVMIVSNSTSARVQATAEALGVPWIKSAKKPLKGAFFKALKHLGSTPKKALFIGDQLMTDVWGANRAGLNPILVRAIKRKSEKWYTRLNRRLEQKMLIKLSRIEPEKAKEIQTL